MLDILAYDKANPLLFNTGLFLILFAIFLAVYQLCSRWPKLKMVIVILFSLYFYYKSSAECCFILMGVCISDYALGRWMGVASRSVQRWIIAFNVAINLGMLIYFKYFNLLFSTFASMSGSNFDALDIILPAGISFFTFRSISYMVDIYRGQMRPCVNFLNYVFFLTFFPPLLAGPVVRAKDMLPQIERPSRLTKQIVSEGLFLIILGLVKKVIVADYISGNFVDRIFENPSLYTGLENVFGAVGFTLQLYCDFSGYSDMAIGLALLLGYRFKDNFNAPFKSQNPTEFWKRWHISLSSWLMDYLYIPLGGNRKGKHRQRINLMTTMLLGGLWHGASWMYVLWGGYHGALLVGHKALKEHGLLPKQGSWVKPAGIFLTMVLVVIGFTFFRASSMETITDMYTAIFTNFHPEVLPQFISGYALVVAIIVIALVVHFLPTHWLHNVRDAYAVLPWIVQAVILAAVLFVVIQTRQSSLVPFIYLQY